MINKKELVRILCDAQLCVKMAKSEFKEDKILFYLDTLCCDLEEQIKKLGGKKNGKRKNKNKSR